MRDKALAWGLVAASLTFLLLAPVSCTTRNGGRVMICGGTIPLANDWLVASVLAVGVGLFTALAYLAIRASRNSDGS